MPDRTAEAFEALSTVEPPISWDDVVARADADGDAVDLAEIPPERSPRRRVVVVLAAAAIVAAVVLFAVRTTDRPDRPHVSTSGSTGPAPSHPTPTTLPTTRSSRSNAVTAWTGTRYLVWSGEAGRSSEFSARADGWAYDVETGKTTTIPTAPIAPRYMAVGVWTGDELIVCCGSGFANGGPEYRTDTAAAYRPATKTWRRLADPPDDATGQFGAAVWTGDDMIAVFETGAFAYDAASDRWRRLPDPPGPLSRQPQAAWTGREMIVWSPKYQYRSTLDHGYRYDPATERWSALPEVPDAFAPNDGSMVWTGDEVIVYGQSADESSGTGARLRLYDDVWTRLPDTGLAPIDWYEGTPGSQALAWDASSRRLVVWPVHGYEHGDAGPPLLTFDPNDGTWREVATGLDYGYHPDLKVGADTVLMPDYSDGAISRLPE